MKQYLAGKNATATFIQAMAVLDGSYDAECDFDEMTNLKTGGFYSSVATIKKASGQLECAYEGDEPPEFEEGDLVEGASITIPGGPGISGDFQITKITYKSVNPKGGVKYNFSWVSEEAYVKTG